MKDVILNLCSWAAGFLGVTLFISISGMIGLMIAIEGFGLSTNSWWFKHGGLFFATALASLFGLITIMVVIVIADCCTKQ